MTFNYNVTGEDRKRLVATMGELLETRPKYLGMPSCAFEVGAYTISKTGEVSFDDRMDSNEVETLVGALLEHGFEPEERPQPEAEAEESQYSMENGTFTVVLPKHGFTEAVHENLIKLTVAKSTLLKKALGRDRLPTIITTETAVKFPWFNIPQTPEEQDAYIQLVGRIADMAKNAKRVTCKEKETGNDKYAFRCFLLRLGFIGAEYKNARKIMLRNLEGSSAFRNGARKPQTSPTSGAERQVEE